MSGQVVSTWTLADARRAVSRQGRKALGFFALVMGVSVVGLYACPPKYVSEAKLFVRVGRESVALDPTATTGQIITLNESRETEINSILEVLRSRLFSEKVVDRLGSGAILEDESRPAAADAAPTRLDGPIAFIGRLAERLQPHKPVSRREKAILKLGRELEIAAPAKSTVISVRCFAGAPQLAQKVVSTLVEAYLEEHVRVNRTSGSHEFFNDQLKLAARELEAANRAVRDAKSGMELASIDGQRRILEGRAAAIESSIQANDAQLAASEARAASLEESTEQLAPLTVTEETRGISSLSADYMRQQLYELEIRERELLSKFTADHPAVAALREQVREAKAILDRQPSQRTETKNALNPTRQPLEVALLNEQANLASSRAKAEKLHAQRELAIGKLKALNESELRLASLQRVADVAAANYRTYSEKLEQARIDQALENQRISNVNVAQPATFVEKPVSPRKGLALMLALIVGAAGALGVALAAEHLDHSLKTPEEVEQRLDLPVLVSVPRIVRNPVLMN